MMNVFSCTKQLKSGVCYIKYFCSVNLQPRHLPPYLPTKLFSFIKCFLFSGRVRTSVTCTVPVAGPVEDIRTSSQGEEEAWDIPGQAMTTPPPTRQDSLDKLSLLLISDQKQFCLRNMLIIVRKRNSNQTSKLSIKVEK